MIGHDDPRLRDRDGLGRKLAEAAGLVLPSCWPSGRRAMSG
jgi:hypothetical protein